MKFLMRLILLPAIAVLALAGGAAPTEPVTINVSIKDHRFDPAEIHAPANTPVTLVVKNLDATPEEFESKQLRVEKIVAGNGSINVQLRPLTPGRYNFFGEYHEDTAQGVLVVE